MQWINRNPFPCFYPIEFINNSTDQVPTPPPYITDTKKQKASRSFITNGLKINSWNCSLHYNKGQYILPKRVDAWQVAGSTVLGIAALSCYGHNGTISLHPTYCIFHPDAHFGYYPASLVPWSSCVLILVDLGHQQQGRIHILSREVLLLAV